LWPTFTTFSSGFEDFTSSRADLYRVFGGLPERSDNLETVQAFAEAFFICR
jgi:hypothetical protein